MKKMKFLGATLLAFVLTALPASAQKPQKGCDKAPAKCPKTEKCATPDSCSFKRDKHGGEKIFNPFIGITLTADQQKAVDLLKEQRKAKRAEMAQQKRFDKQISDSIRSANRLQAKRDDLNQIKQILTPEQYVVYLENIYLYSPGGNKDGKFSKGQRPEMKFDKGNLHKKDKFDGKKGRDDRKGQNSDRKK